MKLRTKLAGAIFVIIAVHAVVLCAGFFAPYSPDEQDRSLPFAAPTRIHLQDQLGRYHLRPFVYALVANEHGLGSYREDVTSPHPIRFFQQGAGYTVAGVFHGQVHLVGVDSAARLFLLGTDGYGRDQFSRLLFGGQISLSAGLIATALSLLLGATLGGIAGFGGHALDSLLMRLSELFLALPWLYLLLTARAFLPLRTDARTAFFLMVGLIGMVGWARPARLVRGVVLSAKERNYVLAARGFGASNTYLLSRHVLPQTYPVLLTQAALLLPQFVLAEVGLSFFGVGIGEPVPSWGNMLSALQQYHVLASYWWMLAPAFVLVPLFFAFHTTADLLQDHLQCAS